MPRKRMIDPEFWSDEEIGLWSHSARLFYIGLWNFADDEGRFKAHSQLLKSQIFPYDDKVNIDSLKKEVCHKVQWYEINGSQYGFIRNFLKHQRIDKSYPSKLPIPPSFAERSANIPRIVPPKIKEDKIKEVKKQPPWAVYSKETQDLMDKVYKNKLNIYQLIGRLMKEYQIKYKRSLVIPEEVIKEVCLSYLRNKAGIKNPYPWLKSAIYGAWQKYHADQEIKHGQAWKKEGMSQSIKQILAGLK